MSTDRSDVDIRFRRRIDGVWAIEYVFLPFK